MSLSFLLCTVRVSISGCQEPQVKPCPRAQNSARQTEGAWSSSRTEAGKEPTNQQARPECRQPPCDLHRGRHGRTVVPAAAGPTEREGSLVGCARVAEMLPNSSHLRCGRPALPAAKHVRTGTPSTHLSIKKEHQAAPLSPRASLPQSPGLCSSLWSSRSRSHGEGWLAGCYLLGYQRRTLGPEAQQLLRRGERQEGGDVCGRWGGQRRSWFLRDGWHRRHCTGPNPHSSPRTCARTLAIKDQSLQFFLLLACRSQRVGGHPTLALTGS